MLFIIIIIFFRIGLLHSCNNAGEYSPWRALVTTPLCFESFSYGIVHPFFPGRPEHHLKRGQPSFRRLYLRCSWNSIFAHPGNISRLILSALITVTRSSYIYPQFLGRYGGAQNWLHRFLRIFSTLFAPTASPLH